MSDHGKARILSVGLVVLALAPSMSVAQTTGVREVSASRSLVTLQTRIRYTTMIVLPDEEEILDIVCGDRDFWVISATHNVAHVKPAKEGVSTNLNLVTGSGAIYSFLLNEKNASPDLKVYVTADPDAAPAKPKYFSATHVESLQSELQDARAAVDAAVRRADETIAAFQQQYPSRLQFVYGTLKYEKPFFVRSIWHDGQFTYIRADPGELPALYEVKDGQPALVNFQVQQGTYVVPKILDQGYLALGKARFAFAQQGR